MIQEIQGDLTLANNVEAVIGHQVNPRVLGPILALALADAYPLCAKQFYEKANSPSPLELGQVMFCPTQYESLFIAHCCGQLTTRKGSVNTNIGAVEKYLEVLVDMGMKLHLPILLPHYLGCGQGGGDWTQVKDLIELAFGNSDVPCFIVRYAKGVPIQLPMRVHDRIHQIN
jgi:hypothetical protein